jgi:hypothetical protein
MLTCFVRAHGQRIGQEPFALAQLLMREWRENSLNVVEGLVSSSVLRSTESIQQLLMNSAKGAVGHDSDHVPRSQF